MSPERVSLPIMANMVDSQAAARRGRVPRPPRRTPRVCRYRIFMAGVFCCVVLVDAWADRSLSAPLSGDVIGPASIAIWAMTLLGAIGIGPMGLLRVAAYAGGLLC